MRQGSEKRSKCEQAGAREGHGAAAKDQAFCSAGPAKSRTARAMADAAVPASSADAPVPTSSVAEMARARYTVGHIEKILLDALGTHPGNRGGLGVSAFHAERVAKSIMADGFSRHRYRDATVVMVPASELAAFRAYNESMAAGDAKLPPASGTARFALLGKNHLVTALKMLRIGSFKMSGTGEPITPPPNDGALAMAMKEGIYCDVLGEALWQDSEAVAALLAEDNLNASVEMGTNEVEILRFMGDELAVKVEGLSAKGRFEQIVAKARGRFGCTAFSETDFLHLHNFATRIPRQLLKNLGEMHFALVPASTLRCKAIEFDSVARLDRSIVYTKLALVLSLYLGGGGNEEGGQRRMAVGGVATVCKGVNPNILKAFEEQPAILQTIELFIKTLLKHYPCTGSNVQVKKLLECRAKLYYRSGRLAQNWPLSHFEIKKVLASVEDKYVKDMTEAGALEGDRPRKYPEPTVTSTVEPKEPKQGKGKRSAAEVQAGKGKSQPQRLTVEVLGDDADGDSEKTEGVKRVAPHSIPVSEVQGVPTEAWEDLERLFWSRTVSEQMVHCHIMHSESSDQVQVVKAEATEPMVWQARAKAAMGPGTLVLVPWAKAEPMLMEDGEVPFKRTAQLHPALPGHEVVTVSADGDPDGYAYAFRSPLDGKVKADAKGPAPFWCVLTAKEDDVANMAYREFRMETVSPAVIVQGGRKNETSKGAKTKLTTKFRILTNICKIAFGEVLVVLPEAKAEEDAKRSVAAKSKVEPVAKRGRTGA